MLFTNYIGGIALYSIWYYAVGFSYFQRRVGTTSSEYATFTILTLLMNAVVACFLPMMVKGYGDFSALVLPLQPMYLLFLIPTILITKELGGTMLLYGLHFFLVGAYT